MEKYRAKFPHAWSERMVGIQLGRAKPMIFVRPSVRIVIACVVDALDRLLNNVNSPQIVDIITCKHCGMIIYVVGAYGRISKRGEAKGEETK